MHDLEWPGLRRFGTRPAAEKAGKRLRVVVVSTVFCSLEWIPDGLSEASIGAASLRHVPALCEHGLVPRYCWRSRLQKEESQTPAAPPYRIAAYCARPRWIGVSVATWSRARDRGGLTSSAPCPVQSPSVRLLPPLQRLPRRKQGNRSHKFVSGPTAAKTSNWQEVSILSKFCGKAGPIQLFTLESTVGTCMASVCGRGE